MSKETAPTPEPYQVWADRYYKLERDLAVVLSRLDRLEREVERYIALVEGIKLGLGHRQQQQDGSAETT